MGLSNPPDLSFLNAAAQRADIINFMLGLADTRCVLPMAATSGDTVPVVYDLTPGRRDFTLNGPIRFSMTQYGGAYMRTDGSTSYANAANDQWSQLTGGGVGAKTLYGVCRFAAAPAAPVGIIGKVGSATSNRSYGVLLQPVSGVPNVAQLVWNLYHSGGTKSLPLTTVNIPINTWCGWAVRHNDEVPSMRAWVRVNGITTAVDGTGTVPATTLGSLVPIAIGGLHTGASDAISAMHALDMGIMGIYGSAHEEQNVQDVLQAILRPYVGS